MIFDRTIYSVVKIRSTRLRGELTEEVLEEEWFDSQIDAEIAFKRLNFGIRNFRTEGGITKDIWESKDLFKFVLKQDAQQLIDRNPEYDAQRLAEDLNIDSRSGELLDRIPKKVSPI